MSPLAHVFALAAAASMVLAGAGAAEAKPLVHEHYSDSDSFDTELCGLDVHIETTFSGVFTIHPAPGSDQAFFAHDNYEFRDVVTLNDEDPTTNEFFVQEGNGNFREQHATLIEGNIYEFEAIDAGVFTVFDSEGNVLIRDRGMVQLAAVFDTLGDGEPGGVFISESEPVLHGPHSDAYCDVVITELT